MRHLPLALAAALLGCQGQGVIEVIDPDATGEPNTTYDPGTGTGGGTGTGTGTGGGACGDVNYWAVTVEGRVLQADGRPAGGADVLVEERGWHPQATTMGSAVANAEGYFTIEIAELVDVEDCWGTLLDYVLIGQLGPQYAERDFNAPLYNAVTNGTLIADVTGAPLELQ